MIVVSVVFYPAMKMCGGYCANWRNRRKVLPVNIDLKSESPESEPIDSDPVFLDLEKEHENLE